MYKSVFAIMNNLQARMRKAQSVRQKIATLDSRWVKKEYPDVHKKHRAMAELEYGYEPVRSRKNPVDMNAAVNEGWEK